ncbi:sigma factor-like helix-turn-helix DNA-binding protein [Amycolatopsis sp. cg9]|uniref:sigma factor-like helix-turn-helix DNA-binding protein n=1 Tax=Amycolatopsis sp. cg9 TaxID=3238801 RepID=UPI0035264313
MTSDEEFDSWLAEADESFVQSVNADVDRAVVLHVVQRAAAERASKELTELVAVAAATGAPPERPRGWSVTPGGLPSGEPPEPVASGWELPSMFDRVQAERNHELDPVVQSAVEGAPEAVERVLQTVRPLVMRYCRAQIGQRDGTFVAADDLAQEICLAVLADLPTAFGRYQDLLRLVYRIAARQVGSAQAAVLSSSRMRMPVWNRLPGTRRCSSEYAGDVSQVWRMLAMLSDTEREVVVLRVVVGLTVTETSEVIGQNPGWVRYKQAHALAALRRLLAAWYRC